MFAQTKDQRLAPHLHHHVQSPLPPQALGQKVIWEFLVLLVVFISSQIVQTDKVQQERFNLIV